MSLYVVEYAVKGDHNIREARVESNTGGQEYFKYHLSRELSVPASDISIVQVLLLNEPRERMSHWGSFFKN